MADPKSMSDGEILDLIEEMIGSQEIGLYPERHDNGADCYICPACGKSTNIKVHAYGMSDLTSGNHRPDCKALRLAEAMRARRERLEETPQ